MSPYTRYGLLLIIHWWTLASSAWQEDFQVVRVASNLSRPLYAVSPPNDFQRVFILEQRGAVKVLENNVLLDNPFITLPVSQSGNEKGLLGLAFHPEYDENGFFYVNYTNPSGDTVIQRWTVSENPNEADPQSGRTLLTLEQPFENHNGGWMGFGPDGYLYVATGDGGGGGDPGNRAQDPFSPMGKILRLDINVQQEPWYQAPGDNPFQDVEGHPLAWAYGLRNPWRCSFDRLTGDFYLADVGQREWEEINFQSATSTGGENYGWRIMEGNHCFAGPNCDDPSLTPPIYEYDHEETPTSGKSITGGYVYRGPIPSLQGRYFFADFVSNGVWSFIYKDQQVQGFTNHTGSLNPDQGFISGISSFGEDAWGNLYLVTIGGNVFKFQSLSPAIAISGPQTGSAGQTLTFTASREEAADVYLWDFGDGVSRASSTPTISHVYGEAGEYQVTVQTGDVSDVSVANHLVNITALNPDESIEQIMIHPLSADTALLSWRGGGDDLAELTGYEILMNDGLEKISLGTTRETQFRVSQLTPGQSLTLTVRPLYGAGVPGPEETVTASMPLTSDLLGQYHLRFPHVAQNQQWWTGLVMVNPGDQTANLTLNVHTIDGSVIEEKGVLTQLGPGEKAMGLASQFMSEQTLEKASWIDLISDHPLVGFELFGQNLENMSGMEVNGHARLSGWLPVINVDTQHYAGLSMVNLGIGSEERGNLLLQGYNGNGDLLADVFRVMNPDEKQVAVAQDAFADLWNPNIQSIRWQNTQPTTGFQIWGDVSWLHQSGMATASEGSLFSVLPMVEPGGSVVIQNTAGVTNTLSLQAYGDSGDPVRLLQLELKPYQSQTLETTAAFGSRFEGSVFITGHATFTALTDLFRQPSEGLVFTEAVPGQSRSGSQLLFPHAANPAQWTTEIVVVNTRAQAVTVQLEAFNTLGKLQNTTSALIPGHGRLHATMSELFPDGGDIHYVRAHTEEKTLMAHLLYHTHPENGQVMGGVAVRPLDH